MEQGLTDRQEIADKLGLTKEQVNNAIENLVSHGEIVAVKHEFRGYRKGRGPSIYKLAGTYLETGNAWSGISFVFWGKGSSQQG